MNNKNQQQNNPFGHGFGPNQHTHNGIDSPLLAKQSSSTPIYGGFVNSDGTAGTPFPSGWTSVLGTGGSAHRYTVTHNLGTANWVVVITPIATGTYQTYFSQIFAYDTNSFTVVFFDNGNNDALVNTAFEFILLSTTN